MNDSQTSVLEHLTAVAGPWEMVRALARAGVALTIEPVTPKPFRKEPPSADCWARLVVSAPIAGGAQGWEVIAEEWLVHDEGLELGLRRLVRAMLDGEW